MPHGQARDVNRDSSCSDDGEEEEDDALTLDHSLQAREMERERERQRQGYLAARSHSSHSSHSSYTHLHGEEEEEEERRRQRLHEEEEDGLRDHAHRVLNHDAQHGPGPAYTSSLKRLNRAGATAIEGRASARDKFTK
jgi:hypothetical protein